MIKVTRTFALFALTLGSGFLGHAGQAQAASPAYVERAFVGKRPMLLDLHLGGVGYWGGGLAFGGRVGIPILHNGFIKSVNNSVQIVVGADVLYSRWRYRYDYGRFGFHIPVLLNWAFYFSKEFEAFVELGPALTFFPRYRDYEPQFRHAYGFFSGGIGARFFVSDKVGIVFRAGTPTLSLGMTVRL